MKNHYISNVEALAALLETDVPPRKVVMLCISAAGIIRKLAPPLSITEALILTGAIAKLQRAINPTALKSGYLPRVLRKYRVDVGATSAEIASLERRMMAMSEIQVQALYAITIMYQTAKKAAVHDNTQAISPADYFNIQPSAKS